MSKLINWKSDWFSNNFHLFVDGIQKGAITFGTWRSNAESRFEDQNYQFVNKGFWQSSTRITDKKTNEVLAVITYDSWKSKAVISLKTGEQYEWKSKGLWKSQWTVSNYKDEHIVYTSGSNSGSIASDTDHKLLIIAGLFIKQVYNKRTILMMACIVPVITTSTLHHH
ncbi:hypothetical protein [Pedobacter zeae]|uniref:Uncharacterized protein n=1 Tax=Pedobacter zeae TaxID=1737356 RepID=A0A7W6KAY7_9SPHI|nr:hypothetical protein [Pedobacter zeae]MBB4108448.1 hypothetical protein [Pedobacter zeae]GGG92739.1 hypothetical protein GCM10007422_02300 [Pedobacter zeae]